MVSCKHAVCNPAFGSSEVDRSEINIFILICWRFKSYITGTQKLTLLKSTDFSFGFTKQNEAALKFGIWLILNSCFLGTLAGRCFHPSEGGVQIKSNPVQMSCRLYTSTLTHWVANFNENMKANNYLKPAVVTLDSRDSKASQDKLSLIWGQLSTKMQLHPGTEDIFKNQLVSLSKGLLRAPQNKNLDNDQDHTSTKTVSCMALHLCAIFFFFSTQI